MLPVTREELLNSVLIEELLHDERVLDELAVHLLHFELYFLFVEVNLLARICLLLSQ